MVRFNSSLVLARPHAHFLLAFCLRSDAVETSESRDQLSAVLGLKTPLVRERV